MGTQDIARGRFNTNFWHRLRFTLLGPIYDPFARVFTAKRRRSLEIAELRPGETVLLLGAGTGLDLELLPAGLRLTAIDITPAMIRRLRRRALRLGVEVDARLMDGQAMDFQDGTFDVVVLHLIVAVIPDPARCLKEVHRVLRPGGRVVVFDKFLPDDGSPSLAVRCLAPVASFLGTEITRRPGPLLRGAGLEIVREEAAGLRGLFRIVLARKGDGRVDRAVASPAGLAVRSNSPRGTPGPLGV